MYVLLELYLMNCIWWWTAYLWAVFDELCVWNISTRSTKSTLDFESYVQYGKQNLVIFVEECNITIPSHWLPDQFIISEQNQIYMIYWHLKHFHSTRTLQRHWKTEKINWSGQIHLLLPTYFDPKCWKFDNSSTKNGSRHTQMGS